MKHGSVCSDYLISVLADREDMIELYGYRYMVEISFFFNIYIFSFFSISRQISKRPRTKQEKRGLRY